MTTRRSKRWRGRRVVIFATLALVFAGLWGATYKYRLSLRICNGFVFEISHGRTGVHIWDTSYYRIDYRPGFTFETNDENEWHFLPTFHFNTPSVNRGPGVRQWLVAVPLWMISLGSGGASWLLRRVAKQEGQCGTCGYDMRGLREARCPECGAEIRSEEPGVDAAARG